jgi:UDP-N-acetylglucosamine:LPS N-acetylglucosamine transferase
MAAANRTLMVMAGGTGGHVYPALAVADALRARGWEVFWLGTRQGLEARVVPKAGIAMVWVTMGGLRGKSLLRKLLMPLMLLIAFGQSLRAILQRRPDVILGMGGYTAFPGGMMASLGASALNDLVPKALALLPVERRPRVVHQSGRQHLEILRANYAAAGVEAEVRDYIEDMATEYQACDFAICRAGAMTVAELACAGVPAVLVPFPHAVDDHQTGNAEYLSSAGAAWLMQQKDLTAEKLASLIGGLDRTVLAEMADRARALAKPEATASVADVCEALAR